MSPSRLPSRRRNGAARASDHAALRGLTASAHCRASAPAMRTLWPVTDRIQVEYESLRALALADAELGGPSALRFTQQGLVGLISWRRIELPFSVSLVGAQRPPWTPYADPRLDALMPATTGCCWLRVISRDGCSRTSWRRSRCCRRRRDKVSAKRSKFR